jgi:tol-pal system protein YbgF
MKIRRAFTGVVSILTLGSLLACVQEGDFRALQGEVRRGFDHHQQQLQTLNEAVLDLQKRIETYETDWTGNRKQTADHLNDFAALQQEVASLRGQLDTWTRGEKGVQELLQAQTALREELDLLRRNVGKTGPPPKRASLPPATQEPEKRAEDFYKEGRFHFESGDYTRARKAFQTLLVRHPDSELADNAQFWIGECQFRAGNFKEAILEYEKVVSRFPESPKVPSALLKQGMAFEKLGDLESARYLYRKITKEHRESDQAQMAEHRLKRLP